MLHAADPTEFQIVPLIDLVESKTNPRRSFNERDLADLAENVKTHGVLSPLLVRPNPRANGPGTPRFEIVYGARRYRAATLAGLDVVPVRNVTLSDNEALELQIVENLQRSDIHPLDEAFGYEQLMHRSKQSVEEIAAKVGKSVSYVYQRLKLCSLIPAAQKAFTEEKITAGHAVQIARLSPADQKDAMDFCVPRHRRMARGGEVDDGMVGIRELAGWIATEIHRDLNRAVFDTADASLLPSAKACAQCPKRSGFEPALFADLKSKDTCTDRSCWQGKIDAHIKRVIAKFREEKTAYVQISPEYLDHKKKAGVFGAGNWVQVKPSNRCESSRPGIVVEEGWRSSEVRRGQVIEVCVDPKCKTHFSRHAGMSRPAPTQRDLAKGRREKARQIAFQMTVDRVVAHKPDFSSLASLRFVASQFVDEIWNEAAKALCIRRGWEPAKRQYGKSYDDAIKAKIADMEVEDLHRLMIEMALLSYDRHASYRPEEKRPVFEAFLKSQRVDLSKLEADALEELNRKHAEKQAAARTRAKKKAAVKKAATGVKSKPKTSTKKKGAK